MGLVLSRQHSSPGVKAGGMVLGLKVQQKARLRNTGLHLFQAIPSHSHSPCDLRHQKDAKQEWQAHKAGEIPRNHRFDPGPEEMVRAIWMLLGQRGWLSWDMPDPQAAAASRWNGCVWVPPGPSTENGLLER
jgi:hypothetical protein